jgi:hypothetical protein
MLPDRLRDLDHRPIVKWTATGRRRPLPGELPARAIYIDDGASNSSTARNANGGFVAIAQESHPARAPPRKRLYSSRMEFFGPVRACVLGSSLARNVSATCPRSVMLAALLAASSLVGCGTSNSPGGSSQAGAANANAGASAANGGASNSASGAAGTGVSGSSSNAGSLATAGSGAAGADSANAGSPGSGAAGGSASGAGGASSLGGASAAGGGGMNQTGGNGATGTPGVRIVGRTVATATGTRFEWSGSNVVARFTGTQVSAQINDGNNGNSFEIVVDGGTPKKIFTAAGQTSYPLATGLANGMHDLVIWRDTEASDGPTEFLGLTGFGAGGALLPPPPAPDRRIEIVGDSFSCGAGMEATPPSCSTPIKIENHYLSYGAIAARAVGADLVTIAWSGIGVYRNYGATRPTPTTVIPARYDYAIPTDTTTTWDFSKYAANVVIMNLNNNDFSTGDPGQPYVDAYTTLYKHIRSKYPDAYIFHIIQWNSADASVTDAVTTINNIVASIKAGGDTKTEAFDIRKYSNTKQCGGHPDPAASQAMGAALAAELKTVLGW